MLRKQHSPSGPFQLKCLFCIANTAASLASPNATSSWPQQRTAAVVGCPSAGLLGEETLPMHPVALPKPPAMAGTTGKGGIHSFLPHAVEGKLKAQRLKGQLHIRGEKSERCGRGKGKPGRREARECFPSGGSSNLLLKTRSSASLKFVSSCVHKSSGGVHITEMPGSGARDCARAAMKSTKDETKEPLPS